jgi:hypothetical protein
VTFNKNGILSITINAEGCGAYCTAWSDYYNYSIISGRPVDITSIIDTSGGFGEIVKKDFRDQFDKAKRELKNRHLDKEEGIDSSEYQRVLEYYSECENSFSLQTYKLSPQTIEIIKTCSVPHYMLPLTPYFELKYSSQDVQKFLRTKSWP